MTSCAIGEDRELWRGATDPGTGRAGNKPDGARIPLDLGEWAEPCVLRDCVDEEIRMLEWDTPALSERLRDHPEFRPQAILRVLCYAYATSVFSSEEVRRRCYSDPIFIGLCDGSPPFAEELMNFRRKNRGLIAALLSRVLQKVFRQKFEIKEFHGLAGLRKLCTDTAVERLNIARHIDRLDG